MANVVLAVDPGRLKCGLAVVRRFASEDCADSANRLFETACCSVVETDSLADAIRQLADSHHPDVIIVGNGTTSAEAVAAARRLSIAPVEVVDEKFSTLLARKRYFLENPPRGLRRLIPTSMQTPCTPCDNYVAVILAERYLDSSP